MCVWVVAWLPQRLKSKFFEKFSSLQVPFGDPPLKFFSKIVDFNLWGKQCIVLPKWAFPPRFSSLCLSSSTNLRIWCLSKTTISSTELWIIQNYFFTVVRVFFLFTIKIIQLFVYTEYFFTLLLFTMICSLALSFSASVTLAKSRDFNWGNMHMMLDLNWKQNIIKYTYHTCQIQSKLYKLQISMYFSFL